MTRYERLLGTVPCFRGLQRGELRVIAGLVDVVVVPAGARLSPAKGEVIVAIQGDTTTDIDGATLAVTQLRLYVFGRRELMSLFEALPDRVLGMLLHDDLYGSPVEPEAVIRSG